MLAEAPAWRAGVELYRPGVAAVPLASRTGGSADVPETSSARRSRMDQVTLGCLRPRLTGRSEGAAGLMLELPRDKGVARPGQGVRLLPSTWSWTSPHTSICRTQARTASSSGCSEERFRGRRGAVAQRRERGGRRGAW
ncbi:hypothetical protein QJS66_04790 [Kocuria rhizophila]|nr:hypothetical protein QJS66_04790 [Kocuria rhizophila]